MIRSSRFGRLALGLVVFTLALPAGGRQQAQPASETVQYTVSLAGSPNHLVGVRILLPPGPAVRDLQLPAWNALYQIRDFSQYVNWVAAHNSSGSTLPVRKLDKTTWRIIGAESGAVVNYEIFADAPGPFNAQLNSQHAFFNLAQILMYSMDTRSAPVRIQFTDVPSAWRTATALASLGTGEFTAKDYDHLVDAPVEFGAFQEWDFEVSGGQIRVVVDADSNGYDPSAIVAALRALVFAATSWMNDRPFATYVFIYHFPNGPSGGGMEHADCTAINISLQTLKSNPQSLADLSAHEFMHLWNVKRIRPQSLEPVDYTRENYTRSLWFSEGVTSTAGNIVRLRAGLLNESGYLKELAAEISELQRRPARLTQSVEEASFDAWLEQYPYYRLPGRSISYYDKGDLLGVLLDLQLREASHGSASLRDVFLWLNQNYAKRGRFFPDTAGIEEAAETVSHSSLAWFFQKYVRGTDEIAWNDFFKTVGLQLVQDTKLVADPGFIVTRNFDATPVVAAVAPGSAAENAGLRVGDLLLNVNDYLAESDVQQRLAQVQPGSTLHVRVRSSAGDRVLEWQVRAQEQVEFELKDLDKVSPEQRARRAAWLSGESQRAGDDRP